LHGAIKQKSQGVGVTLDLASHWPCVIDFVAYPLYGVA